MALSFIGKPISLISHSDVRYRGILAGIDPAASTIQLSNVYSMGTETRRPPSEYIPPVQDPYQYIIFRASEVKDLSVDEAQPPPRRSVHDDPAVLGVSAPGPIPPTTHSLYTPGPGVSQYPGAPAGTVPPQTLPPPPIQQAPQPSAPQPSYSQRSSSAQGVGSDVPSRTQSANRRSHHPAGSVMNATASLESVERALGDLRVNNGAGRGRGRGGRQDVKPLGVTVPTTDFDFETSNARFDKAALSPKVPTPGENAENGDASKESEGEKKDENEPAYNPKASFFDTLSSSASERASGRGRGGGRRGGPGGRSRREEEREKNVATFGEPGGVGLMGPGAYVGGWGGYGRRGGGRGRRGPPAGVGR
ncbi:hypothetical protein NEOLEDRAFT_1135816 [Neolentinus lepideus HHB14362 ss-1]|uniref:TFG box profile domain-containing protein n=1 Tax=Neolentinus lepideus HHB14362 ss-1 TaxID=1314782 RepID=A0A165RLG5_9AGAM|nr:hypothetical protein NEOLEDRAFT_1135816 [Neolentinus lepideus HHB14362 ss-1]